MDEKDVIEKKNLKIFWNGITKKITYMMYKMMKKWIKEQKKIDRIVKKKGNILFGCGKLQKIDKKIELRNILSWCQEQEKDFKRICKQKVTNNGCDKCVWNEDWCCRY